MFRLRNLLLLACVLLLAVPALAQDAPPFVTIGSSDELGSYLVGPNGLTLYSFANDTLDTSNCYERCAENWPPLLVPAPEALVAPEGLPGELGTIERTTGSIQATYNGMPLYYWSQDYAASDTKGNGRGDVWWVVSPATVYGSVNETLGTILVGPTGMTVYTFDNDEVGVSNCYDQCATNWPPLLVDSADAATLGGGLTGELGTTERTDGTIQVTYDGMPLYYWASDAVRGDTTGDGRGDVWHVVVTAPPAAE